MLSSTPQPAGVSALTKSPTSSAQSAALLHGKYSTCTTSQASSRAQPSTALREQRRAVPARALAQTSPAETARATTARARVYGAAVTAKSVAKEGEMAHAYLEENSFCGHAADRHRR